MEIRYDRVANIFPAVDVEKNKYYIQMYKDKFKEHFYEGKHGVERT